MPKYRVTLPGLCYIIFQFDDDSMLKTYEATVVEIRRMGKGQQVVIEATEAGLKLLLDDCYERGWNGSDWDQDQKTWPDACRKAHRKITESLRMGPVEDLSQEKDSYNPTDYGFWSLVEDEFPFCQWMEA